jgi:hypothetical protein
MIFWELTAPSKSSRIELVQFFEYDLYW